MIMQSGLILRQYTTESCEQINHPAEHQRGAWAFVELGREVGPFRGAVTIMSDTHV